MSNNYILFGLAVLMILVVSVSGCTQVNQPAGGIGNDTGQEGPIGSYSVEIINSPSQATVGEEVLITWEIYSDEELGIGHTAIHYGSLSVDGPQATTDYPSLTNVQDGEIPGTFSTRLALPVQTGLVYLRAHAIINGRDYWSDEESIIVSAAAPVINVTENETSGQTSYSLADVALHKQKGNCWLAIHGKVYDVSNYTIHPGRDAILQGCGKNATSLFESRPGFGTPHSAQARSYLPLFYIGDLAIV